MSPRGSESARKGRDSYATRGYPWARGKLCGGYVKFDGAIGPETELKATQTGGCWAAGRDKLKLGAQVSKSKAGPDPTQWAEGNSNCRGGMPAAGHQLTLLLCLLSLFPRSPIPVVVYEKRGKLCARNAWWRVFLPKQVVPR